MWIAKQKKYRGKKLKPVPLETIELAKISTVPISPVIDKIEMKEPMADYKGVYYFKVLKAGWNWYYISYMIKSFFHKITRR